MDQPNKSFLDKKKEMAYLVAGFLIIALGITGWFFGWIRQIDVAIQKPEYTLQDSIIMLNIQSYAPEKICFSSCYPYYIQKKDGSWEDYPSAKCLRENLAASCVDAFGLIGRGIELKQWQSFLKSDLLHRLALPACIGCKEGEPFRVDKTFYSNEFKIQ